MHDFDTMFKTFTAATSDVAINIDTFDATDQTSAAEPAVDHTSNEADQTNQTSETTSMLAWILVSDSVQRSSKKGNPSCYCYTWREVKHTKFPFSVVG